MICSIKSKDNKYDVKEVNDDGRPHVSKEIEDLPFDYRQLKFKTKFRFTFN